MTREETFNRARRREFLHFNPQEVKYRVSWKASQLPAKRHPCKSFKALRVSYKLKGVAQVLVVWDRAIPVQKHADEKIQIKELTDFGFGHRRHMIAAPCNSVMACRRTCGHVL